jgi:hypothetical protein
VKKLEAKTQQLERELRALLEYRQSEDSWPAKQDILQSLEVISQYVESTPKPEPMPKKVGAKTLRYSATFSDPVPGVPGVPGASSGLCVRVNQL